MVDAIGPGPRRYVYLTAVFLLCVVAGAGVSMAVSDSGGTPPNVVVIDIDRLSASHMPCYGYVRNTTPNICRFGEENLLFTDAIAQSGWTASSVASLFTGQYVSTHRLTGFGDRLADSSLTLAEVLDRNGYTTIAFPSAPSEDEKFLIPEYNVDQGFAEYRTGKRLLQGHVPAVREWLASRPREPFFLYVQGFDPHNYIYLGANMSVPERFRGNYSGILHDLPPRARKSTPTRIIREDGRYQISVENGPNVVLTAADIQHIKNRYDDAIREADAGVGQLLEVLRQNDAYRDSVIVVTANHGEILDTTTFQGNKRFGHGLVYEDIINIPFLMRVPGAAADRITTQIELIDVFPTLLEHAGITLPAGWAGQVQGESFTSLYGQGRYPWSGYDSAHAFTTDYRGKYTAVRNTTWKLVSFPDGEPQLFNLETDPHETQDRAARPPGIVRTLQEVLQEQQLQNRVLAASGRHDTVRGVPEDVGTGSPQPPRWWVEIDEPPHQVLKPGFCQDTRVAAGETVSPAFRVCVNEAGFRDENYSTRKPDDTYRIAALGDAVTFGLGVAVDESWPEQLERQLNAEKPGISPFQVLNFGLPFRTTKEEVQWFSRLGTEYDPDLVVLQYMENDAQNLTRIHELKEEMLRDSQEDGTSRERERSFLGRAFRREREQRRAMPMAEEMETVTPYLDRLENLSEAHGFEVMVMYYATESSRRHIPYMENLSEQRGWDFMVADLDGGDGRYTFEDSFYLTPDGAARTATRVREKLQQDVWDGPQP